MFDRKGKMSCYKCHEERVRFKEDNHLKFFCSKQCQRIYYRVGGAVYGKELPALPAPKEHLLFGVVFQDHDEVPVYGHVLLRNIFEQFSGNKAEYVEKLRQFDMFIEWAAQWQRKRFLSHLERGQKIDVRKDSLQNLFKYMVAPQLSPALFSSLIPYVRRMEEIGKASHDFITTEKYRVTTDEIHSFLSDFVHRYIYHDEYVLYCTDFFFLLNFPEDNQYEMIKQPLRNRVRELRDIIVNSYRVRVDVERISSSEGDFYRVIHQGTLFYRGFKTYRGPLDKTRNYAFFAFDLWIPFSYIVPSVRQGDDEERAGIGNTMNMKTYCEVVGGVACFQVKQDLKVLDLSHAQTVDHLKNILSVAKAPEEVMNAFQNGWRLTSEGFERHSVEITDRIFVNWLCNQGYGGYIAGGTKGLHEEALICAPQSTLNYLGFYEGTKDFLFPYCDAPYNQVELFWEYY